MTDDDKTISFLMGAVPSNPDGDNGPFVLTINSLVPGTSLTQEQKRRIRRCVLEELEQIQRETFFKDASGQNRHDILRTKREMFWLKIGLALLLALQIYMMVRM